jgi:UDP-glucose 4-epimerase
MHLISNMNKCVFVTGSAGYIGSHTVLALLEQGYSVVGVDNYCNSTVAVHKRINKLAGANSARFVHAELDVRNEAALSKLMENHKIDACIHFAALKAIDQSTQMPLEYLHNNIVGLLSVLKVLQGHHVRKLVFSSSATVYGVPEFVPLLESARLQAVSPYGLTKLMGEQILNQLIARHDQHDITHNTFWSIATLRYFNPVGAHPSGEIGEHPQGVPSNLMPYVTQTATGQRQQLTIFGGDYDTPDGTAVRDYIHVMDLAQGHAAAIEKLLITPQSFTLNLGTGHGTSVKELIETFQRVNNVSVPHVVGSRRDGDVAKCYADASMAFELLGWRASLGIEDMCRDAWRWQSQNPHGYAS